MLPISTTFTQHDVTLMMFCYPWQPSVRGGVAQKAEGVRYARDRWVDQSTTIYGQETFALAAKHAVDVMVGFWVLGGDNRVPTVYDNFIHSIDSWHNGQPGVPKIAINLEFGDPTRTEVKTQIQEVRNQIAKPRYFRFGDAFGRQRSPVVFWGLRPIVGASADQLKALRQRLEELRQPVGDTAPFVIRPRRRGGALGVSGRGQDEEEKSEKDEPAHGDLRSARPIERTSRRTSRSPS